MVFCYSSSIFKHASNAAYCTVRTEQANRTSASGIDCLDTIHNKTRMDIVAETPYTNIDDKK